MAHPLLTEELLAEHESLDSIAEALVNVELPKSPAEKTALSFFTHTDLSTLDEDIEALEELSDICARQRNDYEESLRRVLDILANLQDTHESIQH